MRFTVLEDKMSIQQRVRDARVRISGSTEDEETIGRIRDASGIKRHEIFPIILSIVSLAIVGCIEPYDSTVIGRGTPPADGGLEEAADNSVDEAFDPLSRQSEPPEPCPLVDRPDLRACVATSDETKLEEIQRGGVIEMAFSGEVTEVLAESPPIDALPVALSCFNAVIRDEPSSWIRIVGEQNEEYFVGAVAPDFVFSATPGDRVTVDFYNDTWPFAPSLRNLVVRTDDGSPLFWTGYSGGVAGLRIPNEFNLAEGDVICEGGDQCIESWTAHRLIAEVNGERQEIGYGQQSVVGGYQVFHGGIKEQTGRTLCLDAFASFAAVALWPVGR
jgi:hypothetical protein